MNPVEKCGLCGHEMTFAEHGYAMSQQDGVKTYLCHADDHSCYVRWTVYKERP